METVINSPCNNKCEMDNTTGLCNGCYRTMTEIIKWTQYTDKQKLEVIQKAEERRKKLFN